MSTRRLLVPVIGRHLVGAFARTFGLTLTAFVSIFIIVEFFDRIDNFLRYDAPAGAVIRYFAFKVPLVVAQVTPFAVLLASLVGLGLLARHNEFVALRACGVSLWQMVTPLLAAALLISVATFVWNETVVPYSARRAHAIDNLEIRKRGSGRVFAGREVWYHGGAGLYQIDRVSLRQQALYGLTVYQLDGDFRPERIVEIDSAAWNGSRWLLRHARSRLFGPEGTRDIPGTPDGFELPETMDDFRVASLEPEALSYTMLRRQIRELANRGVDTSESWVDLHLKIALPAASFLMMLVAVPMAATGTRLTSPTAGVGVGIFIGFSYFVVVALTRALGQSGVLPAAVAAWAPNALYAIIGGYFVLGND